MRNINRDTAKSQGAALQGGFTLGDWLIEPQHLRASRGGAPVAVTSAQMQVMLCLVESKGLFVHRHTLCRRANAHEPCSDKQLREIILAWHGVFGDTSRRPRHIAAIGRDGYSTIARVEPANHRPIPERLIAAGLRRSGTSSQGHSMVRHAHGLLGELRRRRVFSVSASYLVGMWLLLQVAGSTFAPLHLPAWWVTALAVLAVIGLPIIITLAWTYEITSDGVVRDAVDVASFLHLHPSRRLIAPAIIIGVVLMAAVTGFAWWKSLGSV